VISGGTVQAYVVGATPSYLSQPDMTLHFGLANDAQAERLEVRWPDGTLQILSDVEADRVLTIEEPS